MLVVNFDRNKEMITARLIFHNQQVFSLKNKCKGKHFSWEIKRGAFWSKNTKKICRHKKVYAREMLKDIRNEQ